MRVPIVNFHGEQAKRFFVEGIAGELRRQRQLETIDRLVGNEELLVDGREFFSAEIFSKHVLLFQGADIQALEKIEQGQ